MVSGVPPVPMRIGGSLSPTRNPQPRREMGGGWVTMTRTAELVIYWIELAAVHSPRTAKSPQHPLVLLRSRTSYVGSPGGSKARRAKQRHQTGVIAMERILLVDDDPVFCRVAETSLEKRTHLRVDTALDLADARFRLSRRTYRALLIDRYLGAENGFDLIRESEGSICGVPFAAISGSGTLELSREAGSLGAHRFFPKLLDFDIVAEWLLSAVVSSTAGRAELAVRVDDLLRRRSNDEELTLRQLAMEAGLCSDYLSRLLNARFGMAYARRLRHHRVDAACQLLRRTSLSIKEIAHQCGFRNSRRFCEGFRLATRTTPTSFRRKYKKSCESAER